MKFLARLQAVVYLLYAVGGVLLAINLDKMILAAPIVLITLVCAVMCIVHSNKMEYETKSCTALMIMLVVGFGIFAFIAGLIGYRALTSDQRSSRRAERRSSRRSARNSVSREDRREFAGRKFKGILANLGVLILMCFHTPLLLVVWGGIFSLFGSDILSPTPDTTSVVVFSIVAFVGFCISAFVLFKIKGFDSADNVDYEENTDYYYGSKKIGSTKKNKSATIFRPQFILYLLSLGIVCIPSHIIGIFVILFSRPSGEVVPCHNIDSDNFYGSITENTKKSKRMSFFLGYVHADI